VSVALTEQEEAVVTKLAEAWNAFVKLEELHAAHVPEFRRAIHAAQYIVMCRPVARRYKELYGAGD
jgi:hypothetical protein